VALTLAAGAELANAGTVSLTGTGSLVLTGASSDGAKISGAGAITADVTEITGVWQAVDASSGTVTIAAATEASSITGSSTTVTLTAGTSGKITQKGGTTNNLTITAYASATVPIISLGTTGSIVLPPNATVAKITLPATTTISLGTLGATNNVLNGSLKTTLQDTTNDIAIGTGLTGKAPEAGATKALTRILGAAANNTITGATATTTLTISSALTTTGES
ncbi:MAG: hypothetical protein LBQ67_01135, partial [Treponema sp.]|nr:hypothetical protein [Treponema sp.]